MAVSASQALRVLDIRGCGVRLNGDQLIARMYAGGRIPVDLAAVIRNNKSMILDHLTEQERLAETVSNALAMDSADFEEWRLEVLAAPPDDPHRAHDTEALHQAMAAKRAIHLAREVAA